MIDQTITAPPTAPTSNDVTTFRTRSDAFIAWIVTFVTQIIGLITQINATEANINAKEESAVSASTAAVAAANFKGNWSPSTTYSIGDSVRYSDYGNTYVCVIANSNNIPSVSTTYWQPTNYAWIVISSTEVTTPSDTDLFSTIIGGFMKKIKWSTIKEKIFSKVNWTPTLRGTTTTGTVTYTRQNGFYTKNGDLVFVTAEIEYSAHTGTGELLISLPFKPLDSYGATLSVSIAGFSYTGIPIAEIGQSYPGNFISLKFLQVNGTKINCVVPAAGNIKISGFYIAQ